jgi:hypothetical protein
MQCGFASAIRTSEQLQRLPNLRETQEPKFLVFVAGVANWTA